MKKETLKRHLNRFSQCFHEQERENGEKFTSFVLETITGENKKLKPYQEALSDAIYKQNSITTNFDYERSREFIEELIDADFDDLDELKEKAPEMLFEWADNNVDIYTKDLTEWLNQNIENVYFLSEAMELVNDCNGFNALTMAQYCAIRNIYSNVFDKVVEFLDSKL